jgi:hypothetical protein
MSGIAVQELLRILSWNFSEKTQENYKNLRTAGLRPQIWNLDIPHKES